MKFLVMGIIIAGKSHVKPMFINSELSAGDLNFSILLLVIFGLLFENQIAIRIILLLEIGLAAAVGYAISACNQFGSGSFGLAIVVLVIAAVESILLLGFVILLYRLYSISDLIKLHSLQF